MGECRTKGSMLRSPRLPGLTGASNVSRKSRKGSHRMRLIGLPTAKTTNTTNSRTSVLRMPVFTHAPTEQAFPMHHYVSGAIPVFTARPRKRTVIKNSARRSPVAIAKHYSTILYLVLSRATVSRSFTRKSSNCLIISGCAIDEKEKSLLVLGSLSSNTSTPGFFRNSRMI